MNNDLDNWSSGHVILASISTVKEEYPSYLRNFQLSYEMKNAFKDENILINARYHKSPSR